MTYVSDKLPPELWSVTIIILGILGVLSILGISVDMQSTHSSKVAIRERMNQIENMIGGEIDNNDSLEEYDRM
jgi:hypothetical protein